MGLRKIIHLFETGSVIVYGVRGSGKDLLFSNVVVRRDKPYVSNTNYGGKYFPLDWSLLDCKNTYRDFLTGRLKFYEWPYPDGTDIYVGDAGIILPAQYCNELNRDFGYLSTIQALLRHLGDCAFHSNTQALHRLYDKCREQCEIFICTNWVWKWLLKHTGIVVQRVTIYERYDSADKKVPVFPLKRPLLNADRKLQYDLAKANYLIAHGEIKSHILIYRHKSNYDTRIFKTLLLNGKKSNSEVLSNGKA